MKSPTDGTLTCSGKYGIKAARRFQAPRQTPSMFFNGNLVAGCDHTIHRCDHKVNIQGSVHGLPISRAKIGYDPGPYRPSLEPAPARLGNKRNNYNPPLNLGGLVQ
jgi:hypothetical protein